MKMVVAVAGVLTLSIGSFTAGYVTRTFESHLFAASKAVPALKPQTTHASKDIICHIMPDGGDFTGPTVSWAATPDGSLFIWMTYDRTAARKIGPALWKATLRDALDQEPKPRIQVSVHDARVTFGKVAPFLRQIQDAHLPFLYYETAYPLGGASGDGNEKPENVPLLEDVRCFTEPDQPYLAPPAATITISQIGTVLVNGTAVDRVTLVEKLSVLAKNSAASVVYILPDRDSRFTDVVDVMRIAKSTGLQRLRLAAK